MACLNKLAIRGIRSFDDKQISVIEFFSPVTVIVGHNGSGKTTIIECLKYATTGDQPPNTRGGAFVHDPKMANEKEVKAQVKLRFNAANGTRMLAVRNLSVTMKKNGSMTMKTLESILALADGNVDKGGKRGVISTKCAEMDAEIPHLLGVSKAVLENVIFCHQEDSYWPLSEPSTLKKKFDDIFEATKYSKALDSIKTLRKERVIELKAEKERLESLSREKQHADKLKTRISDLSSTIAEKEIEYEESKNEYELLSAANQKFFDSATKFREIYSQIGNLNEKKDRYQQELDLAREDLRELEGTDQELADRLRNFDDHITTQKRKRREQATKQQDIQDDLAAARKKHVELISEQGQLQAEEQAQEQRITERETLIREISTRHQIKGFDHSPLEREKIIDFSSRLLELQRRQITEADKLQSDNKTKNDEYNTKYRQLHTELQGFKQQQGNIRERISSLTLNIAKAEAEVDKAERVTSDLRTLQVDIGEKERRLEKIKSEIRTANYDERLTGATKKGRAMELTRDELNSEFRTLSVQADSRAKLDIMRDDVKRKTNEMNNTLEINNAKFRKLVGADAQPETMEQELERVTAEKDREHDELENQSNFASKALQTAETMLTNLQSQAKTKRDELKRLDKKLQDELETVSLDSVVGEAHVEIGVRKEQLSKSAGAHQVYQVQLEAGKKEKRCPFCVRDMNQEETKAFEDSMTAHIVRSSPQGLAKIATELQEWEDELKNLNGLVAIAGERDRLKTVDIPALEMQIKEQESVIPGLTEKAEKIADKLNEVTKELKDLLILRQHASSVSKTQKELRRIQQDIASTEISLSATGSTKTADDVQTEIDKLSAEIRAIEREKQSLMTERERQMNALRTHESDLHAMQLQESEYRGKVRDKDNLEQRIVEMRKEISDSTATIKEFDAKIAAAQSPIALLDQQHQQAQRELDSKIAHALRSSQEVNMSVDKLENVNKTIERYVRDKRGRRLKECNEKVEEYEVEIQQLGLRLEEIRTVISNIDKEINESGASVANLRENIRVRKLINDISATQAEIDSYDVEEAAKAKRIFNEKYLPEKHRETELQSKYAHIGGEVSSLQAQLKQLEVDLKEFEHVSKKYRDQLIKVKMSDMANNDLEKYAKALDNAIMKYHSLKMEEVNDTMRHLWNKTYQGTDIDGIKISSDNESSTTKRSYNYRVVMTKDQVEMDMRGRCSAGQKMLASIIIRLALADSFGQNCGILALDEPTNALDVENIDALAASLVDIINERKNHANFQLIIITHDENFLRKLGQSDVMEYYWRVSRDSRQKSVIERHRFG